MTIGSHNPFEDRGRALEDAFFQKRDQELRDKLKQELEAFEDQRQLAHVSGVLDEQVLMNLVKAGVRAETLSAVSTIPMVEVAWCDGTVSPAEKAAVLNAAAALGIKPDTAPYELVSRWLAERPDSRIIAAWKDYVKAVAQKMPRESLATLRKNMLDRCHRVAEAAGGFVGLHRISKIEQATIDDFAKAWDG